LKIKLELRVPSPISIVDFPVSSFDFPAPQGLPLKTATLIYNPVAGRDPAKREHQIREARDILARSGIDASLARTTEPGCATELARAAVASGNDLVVVCGGDGTINEVVNGISPGVVTLGILPGGTANIIARELSLPHNPVQAARELPLWKPRRIALGVAVGSCSAPAAPPTPVRRYFLSVAGIGYDAYVISRLAVDFKMSLGVVAYVLEGVKQVMRYSFPPVVCRTDGYQTRATFAVVQRTSRYAGWFRTAPRQSVIKPQFGVSLYKSQHRLRYFLYGAAILARQSLPDIEQMDVQKIEFAAETPGTRVYFELDGELAGILPATFEVAPDTLSLLMP
jgi:diacylglycerol kinase (ATP)